MYSVVLMLALTGGAEAPDCWGGGWCGCYGGWGGCYGCWGGCYGCGGYGYGCYGYGGGYGYGYGGYGTWGYAPNTYYTYPQSVFVVGSAKGTPGTQTNVDDAGDRAHVLIHLPAGAQLTVNGQATALTDADRRFISPPLEAGKAYSYSLKAKMRRDGRTVTASQTILVEAGKQTEVTLKFADQAVAKRAP